MNDAGDKLNLMFPVIGLKGAPFSLMSFQMNICSKILKKFFVLKSYTEVTCIRVYKVQIKIMLKSDIKKLKLGLTNLFFFRRIHPHRTVS